MMVSIHGPARIRARNTPTSLGMKARVCSLIWVAAWKMLTASPMMRAVNSMGAAIIRVTSMACRPMVMTLSGVIWLSYSLFLTSGC
jgi:hypothetical protein